MTSMMKQRRKEAEYKLFQFLIVCIFSFVVVIALLNALSIEPNMYNLQFYFLLLFTITILYKPFRITFFRLLFYIVKKTISTIKGMFRKELLLDIDAIDEMNHTEFKYFLKDFFERKGFVAIIIHHTDFHIADLILWKGTKKYVVKAVNSSSKQSIRPIQEVISSMKHHRANESYVVTNQYFTNSAVILSELHDVVLIDREELIDTLNAHHNKKYIFQSALSFILHK